MKTIQATETMHKINDNELISDKLQTKNDLPMTYHIDSK